MVCTGQSNTERGADAACTEPLLTLQSEEICVLESEWSEPPALSIYCQTDRKRKGEQESASGCSRRNSTRKGCEEFGLNPLALKKLAAKCQPSNMQAQLDNVKGDG